MRFLLIHGSWHGAWCWYKIIPRLRIQGHQALAIDLPGRGREKKKLQLVGLSSLVKSAATLLSEGQKTFIVAHSRYGIVASQLAELFPDRIGRVIYLASFILPTGGSVAKYFRTDRDAMIGSFVDISRVGMWDALRPEGYREVLYHDCSDEDNELAASLLCREPLRPAIARLKLSDENYHRVPKGYIRLSQDRAISPALQDSLLSEMPVERVETIESGHSAYFCKPDELTDKILKIAGP